MIKVCDWFGVPINVGDIIFYTTRIGSSVSNNIGVVQEFKESPYSTNKIIKAKVRKFERKTNYTTMQCYIDSTIVTIQNLGTCIVVNSIVNNVANVSNELMFEVFKNSLEIK